MINNNIKYGIESPNEYTLVKTPKHYLLLCTRAVILKHFRMTEHFTRYLRNAAVKQNSIYVFNFYNVLNNMHKYTKINRRNNIKPFYTVYRVS